MTPAGTYAAAESECGGMAQLTQSMATAEAVQAVSGSRVRSTSGAQSTSETSRIAPRARCALW